MVINSGWRLAAEGEMIAYRGYLLGGQSLAQ